MDDLNYKSLRVTLQDRSCFIRLQRLGNNNSIDGVMIRELTDLYSRLSQSAITVAILEGSSEVFCSGADFKLISGERMQDDELMLDPAQLYELWLLMTTAPLITVSHVTGSVNAGGMGFIAASDLVIANTSATFCLSELLFGLIPACVMPFLIRRIGVSEAHYLALSSITITAESAKNCGLVNVCDSHSNQLLRRHLSRLEKLSKKTISRYKSFINELAPIPNSMKEIAVRTNKEVFTDAENLHAINEFVSNGIYPWENTKYAE